MNHFGIDVADKASAICVVDEAGKVLAEGTVPTDEQALRRWLVRFDHGRVVIEACPLAEWLARVVETSGHTAEVIDARTAKRLMQSRKKTDRRDARTLARMSQAGWYRPVHRKSDQARLLRSRLQARQGLLRTGRSMQSRIRGLFRSHGIRLGQVSDGDFETTVREVAEREQPGLLPALEGLLVARRHCLAEARALEKVLKAEARRRPASRLFMSVSGVGALTALTTEATIDDPRRFRNAKQIADYPGLVPGVYQSGEVDARGQITAEGDTLWRFHLVEAANALLTRGRDCALKRWGERVAERKSGAKARVAVARKLAIILWRMWLTGTEFQPEPATI